MSEDLDPRIGIGREIADELYEAYQIAFNNFAGPPQFRHSVNYPDYHRAGLLGVYNHLNKKSGDLP